MRTAVLVMGVCGVGKSTIAACLAARLDGSFVEADAYHPPGNIAAMRAGRPLTDAMRWGWLQTLGRAAAEARPKPAVIACSALKRSYRDCLTGTVGRLLVVHLHGERALLAARLAARHDHFMSAALLDSQLATLETPAGADVVAIDVAPAPERVVETAVAFCRDRTERIDQNQP